MAKVYQEIILEPIMKPLNINLFSRHNWPFQQDNALAHEVKEPSGGLKKNTQDFTEDKDQP